MSVTLMVSLPASPAQTSRKLSKGPQGSTASIPASGLTSSASLRKSAARSTSLSSKIPPAFALADWIAFSGHSMRSGTMRNGIVSPREPLTRRTKETGYGLWPTPTATRRSGLQSHGRNALLGPVNPVFLEWLMGLPTNHTAVTQSETQTLPLFQS